MNHQSGSAQVVLHSLMAQEGCPGGKDEAPTLLEQKISTFFLRVVKQMPFTGSFYRTASFKYIHICNWSVDRVVNTVLHIDFKSPKERWIDWSHFRDGEEVCKHWLWFSDLYSGLQFTTPLFLFLGEPGPCCETRSGQAIGNICCWIRDIDLISLRRKAFVGVFICNYSLLLLFCPLGCSLLYFLMLIYCISVNLKYEFFSGILASKMWFWELWEKSWPNLSQHNDNNDTIYRKKLL